MALYIDNLVMASVTQELNRSYDSLNKVTAELTGAVRTSGYTVDSLSEQVNLDIAAINQEISDTNAEISMNQTADDGLSTIKDNLVRMRELADQAFSGDYTKKQVAEMDVEYQELADEITGILKNTAYDGTYLFSGNDALVSLDMSTVTDISLTGLPDDAMSNLSAAITDVGLAQADISMNLNGLEITITNLQSHSADLTAFTDHLGTADVAIAVAREVAAQIKVIYDAALETQIKVTGETAFSLLGD